MHCHFPAILLFLLTFAGCVQFTPQPLDPAASARELEKAHLPGRTWSLEALIEEAMHRQPAIQLTQAQYVTAQAAVRTAGERPNPTVALSPQIVTPFTFWKAGTYGVDFDWTFETAGKRNKRLIVAEAGVHAAAAHVVEATWKTRVAVRKALLELYAAEQRGQLLAEAIARQEELLNLVDARIQAGAEPRSATAQPRLLQIQLRMQAAEASKNEALARAALADAIGLGSHGLASANFSFAAFKNISNPPPGHRLAALTHRADVFAALADYAAAEGALRLEIAKQYPDLHLNPGYSLDTGENKWALGIGLTLPILNQNRGPIAEAEAKRREAAAKFNVVQGTVLADCDRARALVAAARSKIALTDELLTGQEKTLATEGRLVASGEGDKLSLLSAQVEHATTLTLKLDALVEFQAALGSLEEATQTPAGPMRRLTHILLTLTVCLVLAGTLWIGIRQQMNASADAAGEKSHVAPDEKPEDFTVHLEKEKWEALALEKAAPARTELKPQRIAFGRVLDPTPIVSLDGELAAAEAALAASQAENVRTQKLLATGESASRKAAETAEAQFRTDEIKVDGLRRRALIEWGALLPAGDAVRRRVLVDQLVSGEAALIRVDILPGDALSEPPSSARVLVLGREDHPIETTSITVAADVDVKTQAQGFILRVDQPSFPLRPGMALTAWLELSDPGRAGFAVPRSAVLRHDGRAWVYAQEGDDKFVRKPVILDTPLDGDRGWFIAAEGGGLGPDDQIIITGAQSLLSEELRAQGGAAE